MILNGCFVSVRARDKRSECAGLFAGRFGPMAGIVHMGQ
ncbi:hypothetical protein C8J23_12818 [Shewanella chilikensis]|uniref:Uncharacterized protein n=1 Tax=Shewanella chilikensis TaxID=558541 RepID=A0ABX5PK83_9GAMM|nr:hypothetical protein C8J23_12818 [Shewanella chilikensis]